MDRQEKFEAWYHEAYEAGRAAERRRIRQLATKAGATWICYSHVEEDGQVVRLGKAHPFADLLDGDDD